MKSNVFIRSITARSEPGPWR